MRPPVAGLGWIQKTLSFGYFFFGSAKKSNPAGFRRTEAFAVASEGRLVKREKSLDPRLRGDDEQEQGKGNGNGKGLLLLIFKRGRESVKSPWIPAFAGMTSGSQNTAKRQQKGPAIGGAFR